MRLKSAVVFVLCFAAVLGIALAADIAPLPERVPHGCYPVRLAVQTDADELTLRLTGTVPDVFYMVMVRSNQPYARWLPFTAFIGATNEPAPIRISLKTGTAEGMMQQPDLHHIPARMLSQMQFTAGSGEDADGDSLPDIYEDLVTRNDPLNGATGDIGIEDAYQDPDGDGWLNAQEYQNGTDPFGWDQPSGPSAMNVSMKLNPGSQTMGTATLTWYQTGVVPEFYTIMRKPASAPDSAWEMAARVKPVLNSRRAYEYVDTNVDTFRPPVYRIAGNHRPPTTKWVVSNRCDAQGIRQTMCEVACAPATNGYALTVAKTVPQARYLMLVKEGKNGFWKASGFFIGGTNGSPLKLLAERRGMLTTTSGPYLLPVVEHVTSVEHPEFICGSGEDADGDGLPDIYEVLATKSAPDKSDTGATGLLDGYKDLAGDGWTALEKYRRRCDPFALVRPPDSIELTEPTQLEIMKAFRQTQQYDFQYDVKLEARKLNPPGEYQALQENSAPLFPPMQRDTRATNLQIRITVGMPEKKAPPRHVGGP
jgi:hypothetical protein